MRRTSTHRLFSSTAIALIFSVSTVLLRGGTPAAWSAAAGARTLRVTSPAFAEGARIPDKYTCDGPNVSPPLKWSGVPSGTRSLALICDDPDAPGGTWVHWVLFGLPPTATQLAEGGYLGEALPLGGHQGRNDFKRLGYGGPCPPRGRAHRYFFHLYALNAPLHLRPGATKTDLTRAMKGHILAEGRLMGTYQRQ